MTLGDLESSVSVLNKSGYFIISVVEWLNQFEDRLWGRNSGELLAGSSVVRLGYVLSIA